MLRLEQICQINVLNWLRYNFPEVEKNTYHFANERKCTYTRGRNLKRMGVKRGVPDLFISQNKHGKSGLWLEIKIDKNYPSKEQKEFLLNELKNGRACALAWGEQACIEILSKYLNEESFGNYFDDVVYLKYCTNTTQLVGQILSGDEEIHLD